MYKLILWGAGDRTKTCIERGYYDSNIIVGVVDSNRFGYVLLGKYKVCAPSEILNEEEFDYIVVSCQHYQEIVVQILQLHIPLDKIIITDHVKEVPYYDLYIRGKNVIPKIYNMNYEVLKHTTKTNEKDIYDEMTIYSDCKYVNLEYELDYSRYRTFEFVAEEIKRHGIRGDIAEFGVFRGVFSAVLNRTFPERRLFLFDTFEGFDSREAKIELEAGNCSTTFIESHKLTSLDLLLGNLPHPEKTVICKGIFPESIIDEAENAQYAFVSLDVDFETSTFEGLKFFYPRLVEGGYIFIHDYNALYLKGIKKAVKKFEKYIGHRLKSVPIADRAGTLIVIK